MSTFIDSIESLHSIGIIEFLNSDYRPTFIIDLDRAKVSRDSRESVVYKNPALQASGPGIAFLSEKARKHSLDGEAVENHSAFWKWLTEPLSSTTLHSDINPTFLHNGCSWTKTSLRQRWLVVSGLASPGLGDSSVSWERKDSPILLGEFPRPSNTARPAGLEHKSQINGRAVTPYSVARWSDVQPRLQYERFLGDRNGSTEHSPALVTPSTVANEPDDTTQETWVSNVKTNDFVSLWQGLLSGLQEDDIDVHVAAVDGLALASNGDAHSSSQAPRCVLRAAVATPEHQKSLPSLEYIQRSREGFVPLLKRVMAANGPIMLERGATDLPLILPEKLKWAAFGRISTPVALLRLTSSDETLGYILLGLNLDRVDAEEHERCIKLLASQLYSSLSLTIRLEKALLKERELSRQLAERAAIANNKAGEDAVERAALSELLRLRTMESDKSGNQLMQISEMAQYGMLYVLVHGSFS